MAVIQKAVPWTGMGSFELECGRGHSRRAALLLRRLASISRPLLQAANQHEQALEASGSEFVHVFH